MKGKLAEFKNLLIDWEMTPEDAVAIYLEWGNNGYRGGYQNAVKGKEDRSFYFIVDTWKSPPHIYLVDRNSDGANYLLDLELPENLAIDFLKEVSDIKGVYGINADIKAWLESEIYV